MELLKKMGLFCILFLVFWSFAFARVSRIDIKGDWGEPVEVKPRRGMRNSLLGHEEKIPDPRVGRLGFYVVYFPPNYDPTKKWPAIFCYHGLNSPPTTLPYRDFVEGKNFVIVGMDYFWDSMNASSKIDRDVELAKRFVPALVKKYNLDPNYLIVAGNSAGGFAASGIAERTLSFWRGIMILGAGRYDDLHQRPKTPSVFLNPKVAKIYGSSFVVPPGSSKKGEKSLNGMPVYIGVGEHDVNWSWADKAGQYYQSKGANITFETYKGLGHGSYPLTDVLCQWLLQKGPYGEGRKEFELAQKAKLLGELGEAYIRYQRAASAGDYDFSAEARKEAKRLKEKAENLLGNARKLASQGEYQKALQSYSQVSKMFRFSEFEKRARQGILLIGRNPKTRESIELKKINARANLLEKKAREAEKKKDYLTAFALYERYLVLFQRAQRYEIVKNHFEKLKADPEVQELVKKQKEERDCQNWYNLAENFLRSGEREKGKEYLLKIIQTYPVSSWAEKARKRLETI